MNSDLLTKQIYILKALLEGKRIHMCDDQFGTKVYLTGVRKIANNRDFIDDLARRRLVIVTVVDQNEAGTEFDYNVTLPEPIS